MIQALIGPIASLAGTWLEGKVEKTKAETGAKVAKAKAEATIMEKKGYGRDRLGSGNGSWQPVVLEGRVARNFVFGALDTVLHSGHGRSRCQWLRAVG